MREQLFHFPPGDEILGVELAGKSWCDGSYRIERPCSQVWVVEQVLEGEGTILVDGRRFTARAGDLYLLPAGRQHCYWADPQNPWVKVFVNLEGQLPGELFSVYGLAHQVVFPQSGAEELLCGLLLVSGNDAATALALHTAGSEDVRAITSYASSNFPSATSAINAGISTATGQPFTQGLFLQPRQRFASSTAVASS